ncbi:diguanylate cyclase (GGDEF)-like protein [Arthrobacter ginsengisoli]|uniref:Diguanylate cyclase (GGDEF)-like protein n=1 Tax=Arthrobacter ginsengisoli TaxID=1356565 RepID=A0ABU1U7M2_9MICC|nr:EAL domain-containing protein [Arthrobacter ginsengisoli]MDR7081176.1 diguanylate cyclase (GGDEF)-like protein [Arthrobacter ginsengisoli]
MVSNSNGSGTVTSPAHPAPGVEAVLESSPDALLVIAGDGTIRLVNAAAEQMFGYTRGELVGQDHRVLLAEGFRSGFHRLFFALRRDPDAESGTASASPSASPARPPTPGLPPVEAYGLRRDGTEFQAEVACSLLVGDTADAPVSMAAAVRDTSHRLAADAGLREALSLLSATLESTADGILVVAGDGRIASVNNRFTSMWGIPRQLLATQDDEAVMGFVLDQLVDPAQFVEKITALYADPAAESHDVLAFRDGRTFERYSRPQKVADRVVGRVWSFRDVTPARIAQDRITQAMADLAEQAAQLKALAFQDPLTGLSNRQLFSDHLEAALRGPCGTAVDVLLLDLDDFKEVNDILGHHAGDQLLIEVGRRLRDCVRPNDVVARLGGDEFVVLLVGSLDPGSVAERIVASLKVPLWIDGTMLRPSLSLGLASINEDAVDASELMRRADVAMYAAKAAGKNRYLRFRPEMMKSLVERTELEAGLRLAVDAGQITVHYQPIVSTRSGVVVTVEALARWERDGEVVPPAQFIPAAERSGLIVEMGTEVLLKGCTELEPWLAEDPARALAVNVSGVQLQHGDFAELLLAVAQNTGVDPRQLVVEVTESVFFDDDCHVIQQLTALRNAGVRVALDDFGTGFSSLGRLQGLPVDTLKIDQSFTSMIHAGDENLPILSCMVAMAHGLGLSVTAEGVETAVQAEYLMKLGCDSLQGFLFSRPTAGPGLRSGIALSNDAFAALRGERVSGPR